MNKLLSTLFALAVASVTGSTLAQELKGDAYGKRTYFDGTTIPNTKEAEVMKELGLTRYCCRKVLLTHVDLIQKL